ncbi:MAG: hypothetical protein JWO09_177 [Bacteroidetes bacterium]|nr:hypothetical protein [Bacteroidota bacterium]
MSHNININFKVKKPELILIRTTRRFAFLVLPFFIFACNRPQGDSSESASNPNADSTYFVPADSNDIVSDTSFSGYSIKTTLSPIKGKYTSVYRTDLEKLEKIYYRDYTLQIRITNKDGSSIDKQISKNEFKSILTDKTPRIGDGYYMRKVRFAGYDNNEFRFDIIILTELYDTEADPKAIIKYFISQDGKFRFEDYPQSNYDSLKTERERPK